MNIAIRDPWRLMGFAAPTASVSFIPAVDVQEEKERFVVKADLPGVQLADIEITAEKGVLTIKGERKVEAREESAGYARVERVSGSFTRRFQLPENVQAESIQAKLAHGVLEVSIPKQAVPAPTRVTVQAA